LSAVRINTSHFDENNDTRKEMVSATLGANNIVDFNRRETTMAKIYKSGDLVIIDNAYSPFGNPVFIALDVNNQEAIQDDNGVFKLQRLFRFAEQAAQKKLEEVFGWNKICLIIFNGDENNSKLEAHCQCVITDPQKLNQALQNAETNLTLEQVTEKAKICEINKIPYHIGSVCYPNGKAKYFFSIHNLNAYQQKPEENPGSLLTFLQKERLRLALLWGILDKAAAFETFLNVSTTDPKTPEYLKHLIKKLAEHFMKEDFGGEFNMNNKANEAIIYPTQH
jgi:hypothetical protein